MKLMNYFILLSCLGGLWACGGSSATDNTPSSAKTAPAMNVVPQATYDKNGVIDTDRFQAVQSSYSQQGARQVTP